MVYNLIVVVVMVMEKTSAHHLVCADIAKWKNKHACGCVTSVSAYMHLIKWKYELDVQVFDEK